MSVTYIIGFKVRPDQRERFLSLLNGVLDAMRHEFMFVNADFHQDPTIVAIFCCTKHGPTIRTSSTCRSSALIARNGTRLSTIFWKLRETSRSGNR